MTKSKRQIVRYSISFKQKVVNEIEHEGLSICEVRRRYGIFGGQTVQRWIREFGRSHLLNTVVRVEMKDEKDRTLELEKEIKKLKLALADAYLARDCAEEVVRQASSLTGIDLKKKFGGPASEPFGKDTP